MRNARCARAGLDRGRERRQVQRPDDGPDGADRVVLGDEVVDARADHPDLLPLGRPQPHAAALTPTSAPAAAVPVASSLMTIVISYVLRKCAEKITASTVTPAADAPSQSGSVIECRCHARCCAARDGQQPASFPARTSPLAPDLTPGPRGDAVSRRRPVGQTRGIGRARLRPSRAARDATRADRTTRRFRRVGTAVGTAHRSRQPCPPCEERSSPVSRDA